MNIIEHTAERLIDYKEVKDCSTLTINDKRIVDISVIIPVNGRTEFFETVVKHFEVAIKYAKKIGIEVALTYVEHSDNQQYAATKNTNLIHIPKFGGMFNKCLCFNMGVLYSNKALYYLFHDCDIIVPKEFFERLFMNLKGREAIQTFKERRLLYASEGLTKELLEGRRTITYCKKNAHGISVGNAGAKGGSIMVSKVLFFKVGGYDSEWLTEYSIEDAMFYEKLELLSNDIVMMANNPEVELVHLWHEPAYNQQTKDSDFDFYHRYERMNTEQQRQYISIKQHHLIKFL
jgi:hypothetical protein